MFRTRLFSAFLISGLAAGCAQDPEAANRLALQIGAPRADAAVIRARETRVFDGVDERTLLAESTQALQDIGFTIEESAPRQGVLAGSKDRDATEAGQIAGQIALTVALALLGAQYNPIYDTDQIIRATLTTAPVSADSASLRVSFERIVTNNQGLSRVEPLTEPEFSGGFFELVRQGLDRRGQEGV